MNKDIPSPTEVKMSACERALRAFEYNRSRKLRENERDEMAQAAQSQNALIVLYNSNQELGIIPSSVCQ